MVSCSYGCGQEGIVRMEGRGRTERYCCSASPNSCPAVKERKRQRFLAKFGVENPGQISEGRVKARETMLINYGDSAYNTRHLRTHNPMHGQGKVALQQVMLDKYGVDNASKIPDVAERRRNTMQERYGVDGIWQLAGPILASKEAREFIRAYIKEKGYDMEQCAYDDPDLALSEWGTHFEGRWLLFDLVVFEKGKRGRADAIIEILEFHGPWHYSKEDAEQYPDELASPYTKTCTVKESVLRDGIKLACAAKLTTLYNVEWPEKYRMNKWFLQRKYKVERR